MQSNIIPTYPGVVHLLDFCLCPICAKYYYTNLPWCCALDHAAVPVPGTLRLDMNDTLECVTINITDDIIVEGTEMFTVHFDETDGNMIMIAGDNTVPVFIEDDEGIYIMVQ